MFFHVVRNDVSSLPVEKIKVLGARSKNGNDYTLTDTLNQLIGRLSSMGVSKNRGNPKSSTSNRAFPYKPSIFGVPLFSETPNRIFTTSAGWPKDF